MNLQPKNKKYVIAISFANYLKDKTGVPKVMMAHQEMFNKKNISYITLFTVKKNILNDKVLLFCKYGLIIDGEYKGIYQMSQIIKYISMWYKSGYSLMDIHLHHLLYNNIKLIDSLLMSTKNVPIKFYLHDYYSMCSNYLLLKNKMEFCGGKGLNVEYCDECLSYDRSVKNFKIVRGFLQKYKNRITYISPSETTKKIFCNFYKEFKDRIIVIPHQVFRGIYTQNLEVISDSEKLRVAYLGMPVKHKGWEQWSEVVDTSDRNKYIFTVFNSSDDVHKGMEKVKISFSPENMNAMVTALRDYRVHIVVIWSIWPETYSYTCFEAVSANAFIITGKDSGNIQDAVQCNNCGLVLKNEDELERAFSEPDVLKEKINGYRKKSYGGPRELVENDKIVELSIRGASCNCDVTYKHKMVNYPLLILLRGLYGINRI